MSVLTERLGRLPRLPRRSRRVRPLEVDGRPSLVARIYGLGSIFGKSLRDSRRAFLMSGLGIGLLVFFTASQVAAEFGTATAREALAALPNHLPVLFSGMLGEPFNVERLAAFLSWRTLNFSTLILGGWSIVALSGTLANEAARGSLDLLASTPRSRVNVALQKAFAHVTAVAVAVLIIGLLSWVATLAFATLPGDEIALGSVLAHMAWLGLMTVFPGSIAWAVAPIVGRAAARGLAAIVMIASYVVHGYKAAVPAFSTADSVSYFGLTANHRPMAGLFDWSAVAVLAAITVGFLALGGFAFRARDIGVTLGVPVRLPHVGLGLGGPLGRSFAERMPVAAWWGLGLGLLGFIYTLVADSFIETMRSIPQVQNIINRVFPGVDIFSTGGVLQLVFFEFGTLIVVAAAGMLAAGWASDEQERRLEVVLSAPLTRMGWALRHGFGVLGAIGLLVMITGVMLAVGVLLRGDDPVGPTLGAVVLGLYAAALVGVGIAVGGLGRPDLAGPVAAGLGVGFYVLSVFGTALNLPKEVVDLALNNHLGRPMGGVYDLPGLALCAALAAGGIVVSAIGIARRDIGR